MSGIEGISWPLFGLVAARLGGMIFAAPFWGSQVISFRFRLAICGIMTMAIVPLVGQDQVIEFQSAGSYLNRLLGDLFFGAIFGLSVHVIFKSMMIAGEIIGVPLGLRVGASVESPANQGTGSHHLEATSATGKLFDVVAIIIFVLVGGPSLLIESVVQSTLIQPVGNGPPDSDAIRSMLQVIPMSFLLGLKIALPITICQLLALLTVGVISRSLPQVSMFQVGMPFAMGVTLAAILFAIGSITILFGERIELVADQLWQQMQSQDFGTFDSSPRLPGRVNSGVTSHG